MVLNIQTVLLEILVLILNEIKTLQIVNKEQCLLQVILQLILKVDNLQV